MSQSSARIPPIQPSDLAPEQQEAHEFIAANGKICFPPDSFKWQDDRGALLGPFPIYLTIPATAKPLMQTFAAIRGVRGVSPTVKETVILVTGTHYQTSYEIYAHERIALKVTNLTKEQVHLIKAGQKPEDLDTGSSVAYDAAKELLTKPGPLKNEIWDALVKKFGVQGAVAVVHYVGNYAYHSILMNAVAARLPEGEKLFE